MCILRYFSYLFILCFIPYIAHANERIGTVGIVVGQADIENRNIEIKIKENIYFGDVIKTGPQTNLQILFDDETVFTIGENTEIVINEFIYDPNQNFELNKISAELMQGSLKVVTGLISKENPENLSITLPTGILATRGTDVQALVKPGQNDVVVLLGPGPNNAAGERPGAIEVSNSQGSVYMDQQFSFTSIALNQPPTTPRAAPSALIQEINQSLNAGTIALADAASELVEEESESAEVAEVEASNDDAEEEENVSENETTPQSVSAQAVNEEVKSVMMEEFNSEEGLLKASIPKIMKIVSDSKVRINNDNITESESSMLNNISSMMSNKLNLVQTIADDNFMAEFNVYLASYELVQVPKLVSARNAAKEAGTIAKVARKAVQEEKAAAKAEGRAVNQAVIKEARAASKEAIVAKKEARQANAEVKLVASVNKAVSLAKAAEKAETLAENYSDSAEKASTKATESKTKAQAAKKKSSQASTKAQAAKKKSSQATKKAQAAKKKSSQATKNAQTATKKASQAQKAAKKEKAAAKKEGRAVNKKIVNKAKTATKKAAAAKKKATQVKQQAKAQAKQAAKAKQQAKAKAQQAAKAKKQAQVKAKQAKQAALKEKKLARAAKKLEQQAAAKAKQAKLAARKAAKKAAAAAKKAAKLAAKKIVVATNTASTWAEITSKSSGSYTYNASSISLTASSGSGSGTVNGASTIDFAARTIKMTYDGTVSLGETDADRTFSTARTRNYASTSNTDYVDSNNKMQETYNFNIDSSGNTNSNSLKDTMNSVTGVSSPGDGWLSTESGGSNKQYFVNTEFQTNNGSSTSDIATTGAFSVNVENLDSSGNIENKISGSKTVSKN